MRYTLAISLFAALGSSAQAGPMMMMMSDFETLSHGEIVMNQFAGEGITIGGTNLGGGPNLVIAFDSTATGTADPDLQDPWDAGNLAPNTILGMMLIIAENEADGDGDGFIDSPDDEGDRPAGTILLEYTFKLVEFGFDLVDVEGLPEFGSVSFLFDDLELAEVDFGEFIDNSSPFYDPTVVFGDNSANRIAPITAQQLGIPFFNQVRFNMGGSGAVDNLLATAIPEPATILLLGSCLPILGIAGRRRSRARRNAA